MNNNQPGSAMTRELIAQAIDALDSCTTDEGPSQEELNRARQVLATLRAQAERAAEAVAIAIVETSGDQGGCIGWTLNPLPVGAQLYEAPPAAEVERLSCGHHPSLTLKSAETGEPLYCELCDCISRRNDFETDLNETKAFVAALQGLHAGDVETLKAERDALLNECDAIAELNHAQFLALENCRLLAARHRNDEAWQHILRFCDEGGIRAVHVRQFNKRAADEILKGK